MAALVEIVYVTRSDKTKESTQQTQFKDECLIGY